MNWQSRGEVVVVVVVGGRGGVVGCAIWDRANASHNSTGTIQQRGEALQKGTSDFFSPRSKQLVCTETDEVREPPENIIFSSLLQCSERERERDLKLQAADCEFVIVEISCRPTGVLFRATLFKTMCKYQPFLSEPLSSLSHLHSQSAIHKR